MFDSWNVQTVKAVFFFFFSIFFFFGDQKPASVRPSELCGNNNNY